MSLLTIDFETYYTSKGLGFRTQTTEEYVRDKRFEVIGASVQVDSGEPVWFSGDRESMRKWLLQLHDAGAQHAVRRLYLVLAFRHHTENLC